MATGTIKAPVTVETAQMTLAASFSSVIQNKITKVGNVCTLQFSGIAGAALQPWVEFLLIPEGFRPNYGNDIQAAGVYADNVVTMVVVYSANFPDACVLCGTAFASGKKVSVTLTYIAGE